MISVAAASYAWPTKRITYKADDKAGREGRTEDESPVAKEEGDDVGEGEFAALEAGIGLQHAVGCQS